MYASARGRPVDKISGGANGFRNEIHLRRSKMCDDTLMMSVAQLVHGISNRSGSCTCSSIVFLLLFTISINTKLFVFGFCEQLTHASLTAQHVAR